MLAGLLLCSQTAAGILMDFPDRNVSRCHAMTFAQRNLKYLGCRVCEVVGQLYIVLLLLIQGLNAVSLNRIDVIVVQGIICHLVHSIAF